MTTVPDRFPTRDKKDESLMHRFSNARSRSTLAAAGIAVAMVSLAACGGGSSGASTPSTSAAAGGGAAAAGGGGAAGGANAPAASGLIAAVSGSTMQVQSQQNGQVAVTWSGTTSFTDTVPTTLSAVKTGDCVFAAGASGSSPTATSFTAATMSVSPAVNGSCGAGRGGAGQGARPTRSGFPGGGRPSGAPGGGAGTAIANGSVTSVSGSTIVVASQAGGSSPTSRTVTVGSSTKLTTMAKATSSAATVGKCATVQGTADSSGTVAATSVRITDAVSGQCGGRFGAGANGG
ncbi:MAG: hypothetical protein QOE97_3891 [Pseudonocardiales bacterium]|jgi:hypothetical protein|nr:hypothetical protein [Pseudonocardiales bacterium]